VAGPDIDLISGHIYRLTLYQLADGNWSATRRGKKGSR
jgi:hypothetical protein